jgi:tetrahydromethanopterin S-methyltransferase subunit C
MVGAGLVGLLWLLWVGGMNLFTSRNSALGPNVVSRTLLPWAIVSALLMLLSAGVLIQAEKRWARKDTLFPFWTSETYANAFEERAVLEIRESLKEIFPDE